MTQWLFYWVMSCMNRKQVLLAIELRSHKCYNCVIMQTPPPLPPEVFLPKEVRLDPGTEEALLET